MYWLIGFMFLQFVIYFFFTLYINPLFFNALGITAVIFAITFSVQYLRSENPFSVHATQANSIHVEISSTIETSPLFHEIDAYLRENHPYTDSNYDLARLAESFGKSEWIVSTAIKSGGYTGFREYVNNLRLEYFKYQVSLDSQRTVKELMYICGFTSRATFYRIFAQQYGVSPTEYFENNS